MPQTWKVELHCHTHYSKDCLVSVDTFLRTCRKRGLDRVFVTDHNTAAGALLMAKQAPDLIVPGEEIMTTQGELLAYFVRESIPPGLTPDETIRRLRNQGAFISVSHPYDRLRKGAWLEADLLAIIDRVDALEVFNSRCIFPADNRKAAELAATHHKPGTVGSDAHIPFELGRAALRMPPFSGPEDFAQSLAAARQEVRLSPLWVHLGSSIAKWLRKSGLSKMPRATA